LASEPFVVAFLLGCSQVLAHIDRFSIVCLFNRWRTFGLAQAALEVGQNAVGALANDLELEAHAVAEALKLQVDVRGAGSGSARNLTSPSGSSLGRASPGSASDLNKVLPEGSRRKRSPGCESKRRRSSLVAAFGKEVSRTRGWEHYSIAQAPGALPPAVNFRRPDPEAGGVAAAREWEVLADVETIIGERGKGKTTELLVKWKGLSGGSTKPSYVLLTELSRNHTFARAYNDYRREGRLLIGPPGSDESDLDESMGR
jgi:hypothetical protein